MSWQNGFYVKCTKLPDLPRHSPRSRPCPPIISVKKWQSQSFTFSFYCFNWRVTINSWSNINFFGQYPSRGHDVSRHTSGRMAFLYFSQLWPVFANIMPFDIWSTFNTFNAYTLSKMQELSAFPCVCTLLLRETFWIFNRIQRDPLLS